MSKRNKGLLIAAILCAALSWSLLPDQVIMQVDANGNPANYMAKALALFVSLSLSLTGVVLDNKTKKDDKDRRGIIVAIGGIAIMVVMLVTNLFIYK